MIKSSFDGSRFDCVVCGGGSAGVAAAVASSRLGAHTLLIERYGFCGGTPAAAMIHTLDGIRSCRDHSQVVVAGVATELLEEIRRMEGMATGDNPPEAVSIHPEFLKVAADRLLRRAGVSIVYHALVVDAILDRRRLVGVETALRDGRAAIESSIVVDATGDADVAFFAGVQYEVDRDLQALTYHFRLGNLKGHRSWSELEQLCRTAADDAHKAGEIDAYGGPWLIRLADGEISLNCTRAFGNPVDPAELTSAEVSAREDMLRIWQALRKRLPDLERSYILSGATQIHVRESRKVLGEYVLTAEDTENRREFEDAIAIGSWPIDIHPTNGFAGVHPHKENPPEPYEIPYRCLVPLHIDGLLVAGRPISTTHRAHGSTRVPGTSMATGQAAGVAAALCAKTGMRPRDLNPGLVREALLAQGANISAREYVQR